MQINLPDEVQEILSKFQKNNLEIYIVGGAVRDILMGKDVKDWDYTTNATPQEILKLFPNGYYDNKFGTVGVPSSIDLEPHEITTYRTESGYSDKRRPDKVEWGSSLQDDLMRRDFTVNAMALSPDKKIIDPYDGQKDLKRKLVKAVGNPSDRFQEDALRLMRAVRIAAQLGFQIE